MVTGLGAVGAWGHEREGLIEALAQGDLEPQEVERSRYHRAKGASRALVVPPVDAGAWLPARAARRMCPSSRFAVIAARRALAHAGVEDPSQRSIGVYLATSFGAVSYSEMMVRGILEEGPETASPMLFPETVANAPAAQVAIMCRAHGPNVTVTQREAGPLIALRMGLLDLASKRVDVALVGAVEEAGCLVHAVLDRFSALARGERERGLPFDRRRNGFLFGEGAGVMVLERESAVRRRGGTGLCRVSSAWSGFDPGAPAWGWGRDAGPAAEGIEEVLSRAGVGPERVSLVVSGAAGTRAGDRLEAQALRAVWGDDLPAIVAPKRVVGEYGGGFIAASVLLAGGARMGLGDFEVDPDLAVEPGWIGPPRGPVLVTSLAAGGASAWAVLEPVPVD